MMGEPRTWAKVWWWGLETLGKSDRRGQNLGVSGGGGWRPWEESKGGGQDLCEFDTGWGLWAVPLWGLVLSLESHCEPREPLRFPVSFLLPETHEPSQRVELGHPAPHLSPKAVLLHA